MKREELVERIKSLRNWLNEFYANEFSSSSLLVSRMNSKMDMYNGIKLSTGHLESNRKIYQSLMKTGALLGLLGEESLYPSDAEKEIGVSVITEFNVIKYTPPVAVVKSYEEIKNDLIDATKELRIKLQETIIAVHLLLGSGIENKQVVLVLEAIWIELLTAKHWLGIVLDACRCGMEDKDIENLADGDLSGNVLKNDELNQDEGIPPIINDNDVKPGEENNTIDNKPADV